MPSLPRESPNPASASNVENAQLRPYEVLALIGSGGIGDVYRARDLRLGREVAVKVLSAAVPHDRHQLHRFEREAQAASRRLHPNVGLSDVAVLTLKAQNITISGVQRQDYTIEPGQVLGLYVFSGPDSDHGPASGDYTYCTVSHAIMLKTIFELTQTPEVLIVPVAKHPIKTKKEATRSPPPPRCPVIWNSVWNFLKVTSGLHRRRRRR